MRILLAALGVLFFLTPPAPATGLAAHIDCFGPSFPTGPDYKASCIRSAKSFSAQLERAQKPCDLIVMVWSSGEIPGRTSLSRVSCLTPTSDGSMPYETGPSYAIDSLGNIVSIMSEEHWAQIRRTLLGS